MSYFVLNRSVHYYETDAMGVVHHSNYLRYFEEARVAWYQRSGLDQISWGDDRPVLAVVETGVQHKAPARFGEPLEIRLQVRLEKTRFYFQYAIFSLKQNKLLATGFTRHVPVNKEMKVIRPQQEIIKKLEAEPWTETWPSNLLE